MIPFELVVAWAALTVAGVWIFILQNILRQQNAAMDEAKKALEAASREVSTYQRIITDVAIGHTTLEIGHDGKIIATHSPDGQIQRH